MVSNMFVSIVLKEYKTAGKNTEQMTITFTHLFRFDKYNFQIRHDYYVFVKWFIVPRCPTSHTKVMSG